MVHLSIVQNVGNVDDRFLAVRIVIWEYNEDNRTKDLCKRHGWNIYLQ